MRVCQIVASFFLLLLLAAAPASATQYLGTTQFTCEDFTAAGTGASILDRDNTGTGQEAVRIDVRDGGGTVIYTLTFQNALGSYAGGLINTTAYTTPPQRNPITMILTSLAGNGLPESVDVIQSGSCARLTQVPTLSTIGIMALGMLLALAGLLVLRRRRV